MSDESLGRQVNNTVHGDQINQHGNHNIGKVVVSDGVELAAGVQGLLDMLGQLRMESDPSTHPDIADVEELLLEQSSSPDVLPGLKVGLNALRAIATSAAGSAVAQQILAAIPMVRQLAGL